MESIEPKYDRKNQILINKGDLIDKIDEEKPLNWTDSDSEIQEQYDFRHYKEVIENMPPADAKMIIHAHWIGGKYCSHCRLGVQGWAIQLGYMYCPYCGALMDEDPFSNRTRHDDGKEKGE